MQHDVASGRRTVVTFATDVPLKETMVFEDVYEIQLQMDFASKYDIVSKGIVVWMFVDGALAGECYGLASLVCEAAEHDIEDMPPGAADTIYCYSTTLLPPFHGRGLAKILVAYWNGLARGAGFRRVFGHATSPVMVTVRTFFGATFGAVHPNWYGTTRSAHFYEQLL